MCVCGRIMFFGGRGEIRQHAILEQMMSRVEFRFVIFLIGAFVEYCHWVKRKI